jgi:conjugal transfer mating pair stabilization protein TraN
VSGGDGGLANKGQAALQGNDAAQSVISSGTTNPAPAIDPNAPFITIGKNAEGTADGIMDGSSQQCTQTTVSKSTFDNYSCSADVAVSKTCTRDTQITGHYENQVSTKTVVISPATLVFTKIDDNTLDLRCRWMNRGTMLEGSITTSQSTETRFLARN